MRSFTGHLHHLSPPRTGTGTETGDRETETEKMDKKKDYDAYTNEDNTADFIKTDKNNDMIDD